MFKNSGCFINGFGGGFRQIFFCIFTPNLGKDEAILTSKKWF